MEEAKFRTRMGYFQILPDKIVLSEYGNMNWVRELDKLYIYRKLIAFIFAVPTSLGLISAGIAATIIYLEIGEKMLVLQLSSLIIAGIILLIICVFGIKANYNISAVPEIRRDKIEKVVFHEGFLWGYPYFAVFFRNENGNLRQRIIQMPPRLLDMSSQTEKALEMMRRENLLN